MHLKSRGRLSAKEVCTICFFAKHAQCVGPVKDMAFRVDTASTGHYNRHLKQALRLDEMMEGSYVLDVPGHDKYELERTVHRIEAMVPHEVLAAELEEDTGALRETLEEGIRQGDWPQSFVDHEVRQESLRHGEFVWPAALYIDGFPFARRDGALAFYVYNLVSERRHLICTLRRSMLCVCGCLGWCSVYVVLEYIRWSFACLASGRWPNNRHDGKMFGTGDELRAHRASKRLVRMALVYIKADWAEFVHTIGLCSWTSILHPCFACFASQDELAESDNFSPMSPHCPAKTLAHYEQACDFCEKIVTVPDMATKARIIGLLFYDKRRTGRRGRTLRADVPDLGLLGGDRLEPSSFLMDVSSFEELSPPFRVLFWRQDNETLCKHRCPLFRVPGVSLQSLAPDTLHTLHLGVFKGFCATVLWAVILADALGTGAGNADVRLHLATARLRHDLFCVVRCREGFAAVGAYLRTAKPHAEHAWQCPTSDNLKQSCGDGDAFGILPCAVPSARGRTGGARPSVARGGQLAGCYARPHEVFAPQTERCRSSAVVRPGKACFYVAAANIHPHGTEMAPDAPPRGGQLLAGESPVLFDLC